jgi:hypothetical protein
MKKIFTTLSLFSILLIGNNVSAQGETCSTAIPVPTGTYTSDGPNSGNGASTYSGDTHSDWYAFTPTTSGNYTISSCDSGSDSRLFVFTGSCGQLTNIEDRDDDCNFNEEVTISMTAGTTHYIEWSDAYSSTAITFTITETVSLEEESINAVSIYPNPTSDGIFSVDLAGISNADVKIVSSLGNVVYEAATSTMSTIDMSQQPAGLYFVIVNSNGVTSTRKLVKK